MLLNAELAPSFEENRTQLEITTGFKKDNELLKTRLVGHAYLPVGADTYEIKLMMLPKHTYYLHKNRDSIHLYTVFAKRVELGEEKKFLNPVGVGQLSKSLENYIELYFPLLGKVLFIDLIPRNA